MDLFLRAECFYIFILNFLQIFLTDQGITAAAVATIFLVAKVWDAVNDPLFGVIIDGLSPRAENSCPGCVDL